MKKHELQDESLDQLGRKLFEAGRIQDDELESIVSAPHLFAAIKNRVKTEQALAVDTKSNWHTAFSFFTLTNETPNMAAAFGALLIAIATFAGFYIYSRQNAQPIHNTVAVNEQTEKPPVKPVVKNVKPVTVSTGSQAEPAAEPEEKDSGDVKVRTAFYHPSAKSPAALKASDRRNSSARETDESDGEFYPVTFTGSSNEVAPGAQIVRVELPRSSLSSMGVDLPDGDPSGTVKADLLISADGVTRGFRLVK